MFYLINVSGSRHDEHEERSARMHLSEGEGEITQVLIFLRADHSPTQCFYFQNFSLLLKGKLFFDSDHDIEGSDLSIVSAKKKQVLIDGK